MVKSKIMVKGQIKNRMKVILAERGMSITDLAEAMDYYYTTVQRFCSANRENVNLLIMAKVCEVLEIQPGDIFVYVPDENGRQAPFPKKEVSKFTSWLLDQADRGDIVGDLAGDTVLKMREPDNLVPVRSSSKREWQTYLSSYGDHVIEALQEAWKEWTEFKKKK